MTPEQTAQAAVHIGQRESIPEQQIADEVEARTVALAQQFSKGQLIEGWFALTGGRGDTARTSKADYAARLARFGDQAQVDTALLKAQGAGKAQSAAQTPMLGDAGAELARLIQGIAGSSVNEERVRAIVAESMQGIAPREIAVTYHGETVKLAEHTHPLFEKALKLVAAEQNVLLVGPAGCGKSHLAAQIARALKRDFGTLHCTAGASEAQVLGYLLPTEAGGAFKFHPAQFAQLYTKGNSLFLLDELDRGDANMLAVLNGALANGHLHIPQSLAQPVFPRGKDAGVMAAANTYGTGADAMYVGANPLDAATLDRFYVLTMDYDAALEAKIAADQPGLLAWVRGLREQVQRLKLRRVVSTRTLQKGLAGIACGFGTAEVKRDMLAGWTADEISKAGAL